VCPRTKTGPDFDHNVLALMQDHPAVAVPVVLTRLRQKHEEFTRRRADSVREWRDAAHFLCLRASLFLFNWRVV
jgi:hypothetical protein